MGAGTGKDPNRKGRADASDMAPDVGADAGLQAGRGSDSCRQPRAHGTIVIFALIVLALVLAIGFFYVTKDQHLDRKADAVTHAAESVDDAARTLERAAKNAADKLRNKDD